MEKVCSIADIPAGSMRGFTVQGIKILVANTGGSFHAISAICSHMQGYLPDGRLEGTTVICPVHGAQYDVMTGRVTRDVSWVIRTATRKGASDLPSYRVEVKDGAVFVDLTGSSPASRAGMPDQAQSGS